MNIKQNKSAGILSVNFGRILSFFKNKIFIILFVTACLLNAIPVLFNTFVLSLDGPAHLYNSNLILELLKGNPVVSNYVSFNNLHFTNWTGHLILALFNLVAPAWIAQKAFLIILIISFPVSFAFMVNRLNYNSRYLSFIVFPFSYSRFFFLGFYNFYLGIIFFFLWMAFIYKESRVYSIKEKALIFALFILMECSHVFMFGLALAIFSVYLLLAVFQKNKFRLLVSLKEMFHPLLNILVLSSGGLLLFLFYFFNNTGQIIETQNISVSWDNIFSDVFKIAPLISLSDYFRSINHILFILLGLTTVFLLIRKNSAEKQKNRNFMLYSALLTLCLYVLTMAFFVFAFYIQIRFLLMFFLLLLIWIVLQKVPKLLQIGLVIFSLFISTLYVEHYQKNLSILSSSCYNVYDTGWKIEKNARVYSINFSNHWLESHLLNYLGADNPIILYDNYECFHNYFPLKWKSPEMIHKIGNDFNNGVYSKLISENIDYVAILDEPNQNINYEKIKSLALTKNYFSKVIISKDKRLVVYKKNNDLNL